MKLFIRWVIATLAIAAAAWILPGISVAPNANSVVVFAVMAIILGFLNAFVRPILELLSCGCIVATMGLFMLVINAVILLIADWIAGLFGIGFQVDGFWTALLGSIIISLVSFILSILLIDDKRERRERRE
jgi:putative membrane protein